MFSQIQKFTKVCQFQAPLLSSRLFSKAANKPITPTFIQKETVTQTVEEGKVILLTKKHVPQSPLKMKFLVRLVRGSWIPDAMAQMKFSPKHRATDIAKMLNRGIVMARDRYGAVPDELLVKEVMITKGFIRRGVRIMGRGRAGRSAQRTAHVRMKIEVADFDKLIADATTKRQKERLMERRELIATMKPSKSSTEVIDVVAKK